MHRYQASSHSFFVFRIKFAIQQEYDPESAIFRTHKMFSFFNVFLNIHHNFYKLHRLRTSSVVYLQFCKIFFILFLVLQDCSYSPTCKINSSQPTIKIPNSSLNWLYWPSCSSVGLTLEKSPSN